MTGSPSWSVWLGPEFENGQSIDVDSVDLLPAFKHERDGVRQTLSDIGLIKLKDQVKLGERGKYYENNLICLPVVNMTIDHAKQFALLSGWGINDSGNMKDNKMSKISGLQIELYKDKNMYPNLVNGLGMSFVSKETCVCVVTLIFI